VSFRFFVVLTAVLSLGLPERLRAQINDTQTNTLQISGAQTNNWLAEVQAVIGKINAKLMAGQMAETNLATEITEFDNLVAKYKQEKADGASQILFAKIKLYVEVLGKPERGIELLHQLKRDFPETPLGKEADSMVAQVQGQLEIIQIQRKLVPGAQFPDFEAKDLAGKPISVANYRGKVVLVDFWATWCMPCQIQLPYVMKAYDQFHGRGFDVIGITLDEDEQRFKGFLQDRKMAWPQVYEGKGFEENSLTRKYAVMGIPTTFLIDPEGKILARDLRGDALLDALAKVLPASKAPASSPAAAN
jgi:peroxiredoxin